MNVSISISPKKIARILTLIVMILIVAFILSIIVTYGIGHDKFHGSRTFVRLFNLDTESNIPTFYSSSTLMVCSILLAAITLEKRRINDQFFRHWIFLSGIFLALSVDEAASIHEYIDDYFWLFFYGEDVPIFFWIVPAIIFVIVLGKSYFRFLLDLPIESRRLFVLSGGIFLMGTVFLEGIGGMIYGVHGKVNLKYALVSGGGEALELSSIVLFIYALLRYIEAKVGDFSVSIRD